MIKKFTILFSVFALLLCLGAAAFGQETTGDIEITVKDPNGAVVPNVSITISSSNAAGFKRTVTTDENGSVRVIKLSPGLYTITAAATSGFAEKIVPGVQVVLGRATPVSVDLGVANVDPTTVTVNSTDVSPVDTTDSKIQTNITAETAELLPKGTNFASILKVAPSTRPEPRSGQFQIDGASGSENTFIIDGQEVTNVRTGVLDANSNLPFQLVQEVQIKSSGFPAEYGGATGGVINLVTKAGSNVWRGEFGAIFRPSGLNALGRPILFHNTFCIDPLAGCTMQNDYIERFAQRRDNYYEFNPLVNLSGPILKDKVWFRLGYNPQLFKQRRLIDYVDPINRNLRTYATQVYKFRQLNENMSLRIDSQPISRLNLTATYNWNPISQDGEIPGWTSSLFARPLDPASCQAPVCQAGNLSVRGAAYLNQTGGRQNSQSATLKGDWTIMGNLVLSVRGGHYFLNEKLGTYGIGDSTIPRVTCSALSINPFPAGFGCTAGTNNGIPLVDAGLFDATTRNTFDADATFITSFGGRHEFKGGYQYNGIGNTVSSKFTDQIVFRSGWTIADYANRPNLQSSPNAFGAGLIRIFGTQGDVSSKNEGIFFQDKWQPLNRLTLNLGLRTEREDVPTFAPGLPGMKFDFQDKLAPRIGGAYDLTGDGKTKVSVFYGWFYDRFKYELPRGSFGGDVFHDFFFELLPGDTLASLTVANVTGGQFRPGGACPGGTTTPVFVRVRCDIDYRVPSNAGLPITEAGGIDPNIKAFRQSEFTVTFQRDIGRNFVFSSRFTRKEVLDVIEDAGFPNAAGSEFYIIGNPGQGLYAETAQAFGLKAIKPQRRYDAVEFILDKYLSNGYQFNLNYTWGRLVGNYSGLASSDEDGRLSPNVNRFFDQPQAGWTVAGGQDNGVLSTDRPHVLKFSGSYTLDWKKKFGLGFSDSTDFGLITSFQSGTPLTTVVDVNGIGTVVLTERGDMGRTEMFTGTDFSVRNRFKFGKDDRFTLVTEVDILNLFNESNELLRVNTITLTGFNVRSLITQAQNDACDFSGDEQPCLIAGYKIFQNSGAPSYVTFAKDPANRYILYNQPSAFQGPRQVRFGLRFLF
jgi:hypothetical protein